VPGATLGTANEHSKVLAVVVGPWQTNAPVAPSNRTLFVVPVVKPLPDNVTLSPGTPDVGARLIDRVGPQAKATAARGTDAAAAPTVTQVPPRLRISKTPPLAWDKPPVPARLEQWTRPGSTPVRLAVRRFVPENESSPADCRRGCSGSRGAGFGKYTDTASIGKDGSSPHVNGGRRGGERRRVEPGRGRRDGQGGPRGGAAAGGGRRTGFSRPGQLLCSLFALYGRKMNTEGPVPFAPAGASGTDPVA